MRLGGYFRWRWAHFKWFYEPFPAADPKMRRALPKDPALRRQTLRLMSDRWKAREPKREDFA